MAVQTHTKLFVACLVAGLITGCSSIRVIRSPDESDTGVRFYRPKPYLLVTPAEPTGRMVNLKLEYLPDFGEEYSAHIRGKTSIALKDGWNLVGVNTKEAPAEKAAPPLPVAPMELPKAVVAATNVPMGYYESIFETYGGKKYLKGWRYVGFTVLGGGRPDTCHKPAANPKCPDGNHIDGCVYGPLYGLVFFNGVMTLRTVDEVANNQLCPVFVNPAPTAAPEVVAPLPDPIRGTEPQPKGEEKGTEIQPKPPTPPDPGQPKTPTPPDPSLPIPKAARRAAEVRKILAELPPLPAGLGR
jgi:hypothetical protein